VGSYTLTESLVHYWLTSASDDCLRERLSLCLSGSHADVTVACLNWIETSCGIAQHSDDTQLLLQVNDCLLGRILSYCLCTFMLINVSVIVPVGLVICRRSAEQHNIVYMCNLVLYSVSRVFMHALFLLSCHSQMRGLHAMAMSICSSVCLFVCLSPVKFV